MHKSSLKFLTLTTLTMALALSGCSSNTSTPGASANASESHLTKILKTKTVRIGVIPDGPPWGVVDASGNRQGFDIDAANALGKALGSKVVFISSTNESRIPLLQTNKADVMVAALTATNARAQSVEMTIPYAAGGQVIMLPKGSPIKSYADLDGKTISTTRGSIGDTVLESRFPKAKATKFDSIADAIQALRSHKVDALIESNSVVPLLVKANPGTWAQLDAPQLNPSLVSFGVQQGDQLWLNYLNNFIRNYNISKEADASYEKWLGGPVPDMIK